MRCLYISGNISRVSGNPKALDAPAPKKTANFFFSCIRFFKQTYTNQVTISPSISNKVNRNNQ